MKTTKSQKTQYRGEITMLEFLKVNPGLTAREIAKVLDRSMCSVSGQLRQLHSAGRIPRMVSVTVSLPGSSTICRLDAPTSFE